MEHKGFTPGPWHGDPEGYCEYIWGPNDEMIAQVRGAGAGLPREANQRLLVDAPRLLAENIALRESHAKLVEALHESADALDQIWAAIGDALLSGKGIEKAYANAVGRQAQDARDKCRAAAEKLGAQ